MQSELLQEIERAAAAGKQAPERLDPPEFMLYYMLLGLFASYRAGKFSADDGKYHKAQIYNVYKRYSNEYIQFTTICKEYQKRIREGYHERLRNIRQASD